MSVLVYGVGVLDSPNPVRIREGSKIVWECPAYTVWKGVLKRSCSDLFKIKNPEYIDCIVCEQWKVFSVFKEWWDKNHYGGQLSIDKDLLGKGKKIYSPETCCLIPQDLNMFISNDGISKGLKCGSVKIKKNGKYRCQVRNPFTKKIEFIGEYCDPEFSHEMWRKRKHELSLIWADKVPCKRVKDALRTRYIS